MRLVDRLARARPRAAHAFPLVSHRITGLEDAEVDASLDGERNAPTLEERKTILQTQTMPLLAAKAPALSLFTSAMIHAMQAELKGLYIYPDGSIDASRGA